jgi:peptide-methionine (R)-S-oxide reductase
MFESDLDRDVASKKVRRRAFLASTVSAIGGVFLWSLKKPRLLEASAPAGPAKEVKIVQFSDAGERLKEVQVPMVVKSEDEWRKQLTPNAFNITRHADTEMAFSGEYAETHDRGLYRCICCDNALFSSQTKFDSGTGWPSFWAPIAKENVREIEDKAYGMVRTAVACTLCDAHLGHVFDDGPEPTGLRYCMNSASLRFVKRS